MFYQKMAVLCLLSLLTGSALLAEENSIKLEELDGNWHLRSADGKSVRQARAILEFDSAKMHTSVDLMHATKYPVRSMQALKTICPQHSSPPKWRAEPKNRF